MEGTVPLNQSGKSVKKAAATLTKKARIPMSGVVSVVGICASDDGLISVRPRTHRHHQMTNTMDMGILVLSSSF